MPRRTDRVVTKRATNVSIRSDLLEAARASGVNLSATLERALAEELKQRQQQKWREENRDAITAYNDHVNAKLGQLIGCRSANAARSTCNQRGNRIAAHFVLLQKCLWLDASRCGLGHASALQADAHDPDQDRGQEDDRERARAKVLRE